MKQSGRVDILRLPSSPHRLILCCPNDRRHMLCELKRALMQALNAFFWSAEYILLSRLNRNPSLSHNDDHVTVMQTLVLSSVVALSFGQCPLSQLGPIDRLCPNLDSTEAKGRTNEPRTSSLCSFLKGWANSNSPNQSLTDCLCD